MRNICRLTKRKHYAAFRYNKSFPHKSANIAAKSLILKQIHSNRPSSVCPHRVVIIRQFVCVRYSSSASSLRNVSLSSQVKSLCAVLLMDVVT